MGNFNITLHNPNVNELIEDHKLCTLISEFTYYQSTMHCQFSNKQKKKRFINALTFETGVLHRHKFIGTMIRSTFAKSKSKKYFTTCTKMLIMKSLKEN